MKSISDEQIQRAEELLKVEKAIIKTLKALKPEQRARVLKAVIILYGLDDMLPKEYQ